MICESRLQQIVETRKICCTWIYHYSVKTAYCTEPEIGNSTHKNTGENRQLLFFNCNCNFKQTTTTNVNGSQNVGLYYIISIRHIQGPHKNCNASYIDPFQLEIC